jgi:hypothetical protein
MPAVSGLKIRKELLLGTSPPFIHLKYVHCCTVGSLSLLILKLWLMMTLLTQSHLLASLGQIGHVLERQVDSLYRQCCNRCASQPIILEACTNALYIHYPASVE